MIRKKLSLLVVLSLILLYSCANTKMVYRAINSKRTIIIENDSILRYTELVGGLGNSNTLNYIKKNHTVQIISTNDSIQKGIFSLASDLYSSELIMQEDSIIIKKTGEVFYDERFFKSKINNRGKKFYLIVDNKIIKIKKSNISQLLAIKTDSTDYNIIELDKNKAKDKYGINSKYRTFKFIKK